MGACGRSVSRPVSAIDRSIDRGEFLIFRPMVVGRTGGGRALVVGGGSAYGPAGSILLLVLLLMILAPGYSSYRGGEFSDQKKKWRGILNDRRPIMTAPASSRRMVYTSEWRPRLTSRNGLCSTLVVRSSSLLLPVVAAAQLSCDSGSLSSSWCRSSSSSKTSSSSCSFLITRPPQSFRRSRPWGAMDRVLPGPRPLSSSFASSSSSSRTTFSRASFPWNDQDPAAPIPSPPRVVVVGGGASGIFAAIAVAEQFQHTWQQPSSSSSSSSLKGQVLVLEATPQTLTKVLISGGGRCNVLHDTTKPLPVLLQGYPRGAVELQGLYHKRFGPVQARQWFEQVAGVPLKTEPDGRMFPTTDSSQTIADALLSILQQQYHIPIWTRTQVKAIHHHHHYHAAVAAQSTTPNSHPNDVHVDQGTSSEKDHHHPSSPGTKDDHHESLSSSPSSSTLSSSPYAFTITIETKERHPVATDSLSPGLSSPSSSSSNTTTTTTTTIDCDAVIVATGSAPAGYRLVQNLGHTLVPTVPSLFTLSIRQVQPDHGAASSDEAFLAGLAGVSVPWARVTLSLPPPDTTDSADPHEPEPGVSNSAASLQKSPKKNIKRKKAPLLQQEGPLLITHQGLSGPAALRLSAFAARELAQCKYRADLLVHWAPALGSCTEIADALWKVTQLHPKKTVQTVCPLTTPPGSSSFSSLSSPSAEPRTSAVPRRLWTALATAAGVPSDLVWASISKKQVRALAQFIAECPLTMIGKGTFKEEFVTAGGIDLKEMDMRTMQSKLVPGLFGCGEVLNVDGITGGYNFMNCWGTGRVAGISAAEFALEMASQRVGLVPGNVATEDPQNELRP